MALHSHAFPHQQDDMVRVVVVLNQDYGDGVKGESILRLIRQTAEWKHKEVLNGYQNQYRSYEAQMNEYRLKGVLSRLLSKKPRPPRIEGDDQVYLNDLLNTVPTDKQEILMQVLDDFQDVGLIRLERSAEQVTSINLSLIVLTDLGYRISESLL